MTPRQTRIRHRFALGIPLLVLAASCTPLDGPKKRYQVTLDIPPSPASLLRGMALDVPRDVVDALPADLADAAGVKPIAAAPPFMGLAATASPDDAGRAIDCLTAAVYYEARSQSDDGQRAVAQIVLNRVRDRAFPDSVCGVVYQGSHRATGCQFSFTCDGSMAFRRDPRAWNHAREIAIAALSGAVYAPVGSATFYHADYVQPWWASSMDRIAAVGAHIFYRWRGRLENALAFRQNYAGTEPLLTGRAPAPAAPEATATNALYAETEVVGSVTIHRGMMPGTAKPIPAAADAVPAQTPAFARPTVTVSAGVRIHRGAMPAALVGAPGENGITLSD